MTTDNTTSTKTTRYTLAGALLILGTVLLQFESIGPRFIAVLSIVIAALLFFQPRLLTNLIGIGESAEVESDSLNK